MMRRAAGLRQIVDRFPSVRMVVAGDLIADEFIYGRSDRVSREAPVLILKYDSTDIVPGGAGNAANNASRLIPGGPGIGFGASLPVSRCCFSHRFTVGNETANVSTTSDRFVPRPTAATTRSRKSSEYAFIPEA